jgi:hypothetical protein
MVLNPTMSSTVAKAAALAAAMLFVGQVPESLAHSGTKEEQDACTPDVTRLCSAAMPNEPRIVACLKRNLSKLSPACRSVMTGGPVTAKKRLER